MPSIVRLNKGKEDVFVKRLDALRNIASAIVQVKSVDLNANVLIVKIMKLNLKRVLKKQRMRIYLKLAAQIRVLIELVI